MSSRLTILLIYHRYELLDTYEKSEVIPVLN
jgi:hypothetical protein